MTAQPAPPSRTPVRLAHAVTNPGAVGDVPLVLLHSLALDRRVWAPVLPLLTVDRPVVTCDLRGHGASPASSGFTIEEMADDVAAMLDTLPADRVAVAGLSLGGSVAQAFACRYPQRTASLALIDTTAWYGPAAAGEWAARAERARSSGLRSLAQFQLDRWFSDDFAATNPDLCADLLDCFASNDLTSYAATCHALGALDVRAALPGVQAPTLVLVGSEDQATPPSHARDLCERIPNAALRVLEGARHLTTVERPREVAGLLNGFFGSNES